MRSKEFVDIQISEEWGARHGIMAKLGPLAAKVVRNLWKWKMGMRSPFFASYIVSGRCNLSCSFCNWPATKMAELGTEDALLVVDRVCQMGVPFLHFSGGEPMLREDLSLLASRASSYGCIVGMSTNGTLVNEENAGTIAAAFDMIVVSIDGPRDLHDKYRGSEGTFDKAVRAIRLLKAHRVRVGVNTIVAPWNIDLVPEFIEGLYGFADFVAVQPVHPYPPLDINIPSARQVSGLVENLERLKRKHPSFLAVPTVYIRGFEAFFRGCSVKLCDAGDLYFAVDSSGGLLPCAALSDAVLGSVLEYYPEEILENRFLNQNWAKVDACKGCWLQCSSQASIMILRPFQEAVSLSGALLAV